MNITIHQLLAFDAVVSAGGIQAGANQLNKTHPTIIATIKNMETQLSFTLFDRSGYRLVLTKEG